MLKYYEVNYLQLSLTFISYDKIWLWRNINVIAHDY